MKPDWLDRRWLLSQQQRNFFEFRGEPFLLHGCSNIDELMPFQLRLWFDDADGQQQVGKHALIRCGDCRTDIVLLRLTVELKAFNFF